MVGLEVVVVEVERFEVAEGGSVLEEGRGTFAEQGALGEIECLEPFGDGGVGEGGDQIALPLGVDDAEVLELGEAFAGAP